MKKLNTSSKLTNQNSTKVPKSNKIGFKTLGTSVIYSLMTPNMLCQARDIMREGGEISDRSLAFNIKIGNQTLHV